MRWITASFLQSVENWANLEIYMSELPYKSILRTEIDTKSILYFRIDWFFKMYSEKITNERIHLEDIYNLNLLNYVTVKLWYYNTVNDLYYCKYINYITPNAIHKLFFQISYVSLVSNNSNRRNKTNKMGHNNFILAIGRKWMEEGKIYEWAVL